MEAWKLALFAWYGLNLLAGLVGAGIEAARRSRAGPATLATEEVMIERPQETWVFSIPDLDDHWAVRR